MPSFGLLGYDHGVETEQPSLRERRRAQTRRELAAAAAELFTAQGVVATTAEEIAARAAISLRTFYRYFRTKEEAIAPLLEIGAERWQDALRAVPAGSDGKEAVTAAIRHALTPQDRETADGMELVRNLLIAAEEDAELAGVWAVVNARSERELLAVMADRFGAANSLLLRLHATAATAAVRVGLEAWAADVSPAPGDDDGKPGHPASSLAVEAFRRLSAGL